MFILFLLWAFQVLFLLIAGINIMIDPKVGNDFLLKWYVFLLLLLVPGSGIIIFARYLYKLEKERKN